VIDIMGLFDLFKRHVSCCPRAGTTHGKRHRIGIPFFLKTSQSKVRNLHTALFINEDILRLDVTMKHALLMRVVQSITKTGHNA
jgi:hypothetical protein